ncbi:MAG: hypothetical protein EXS14_06185 [Planctomycetes bacterium]|nr:hypothetical protein [Planctomycetota bacterium]
MNNNPTESNRPLRSFERVLKGGLGAGNIGAIVSPHGTGKNAILTSIAIDHAMAGHAVLHIAVGKSVSDIRAYHDQILSMIEASITATDHAELLTNVERHSQIYTFRNGQFDLAKLSQVLTFLAQHAEFRPKTIMFQGWPEVANLHTEELLQLREIAADNHCEMWLPLHTPKDTTTDATGLPAGFGTLMEHLEVVVTLGAEGKTVPIRFVKVHGGPGPTGAHLEFDPTTMLIRWH